MRARALTVGVSERTLWNWLRWYEQAGDIRALLRRIGQRRRGRPINSQALHEIIAHRLEARWLRRPPWPLTDVALEVIAEVEHRNRERASPERIPLTRTSAGQASLPALVRMVQRQAKQIDAHERSVAQQGQVAARSYWDINVGDLRVDRLLDRVDYDAVRLPILVVDEVHRLVIGEPWLVFGVERKSGMPHGYFLSWEPPNYRSVLECLLFGILPKQSLNTRFPSLRGAWECEGLPRAIAIDNGPEFANRHLDAPHARSTSTYCRARSACPGSRASSRASLAHESAAAALAARHHLRQRRRARRLRPGAARLPVHGCSRGDPGPVLR